MIAIERAPNTHSYFLLSRAKRGHGIRPGIGMRHRCLQSPSSVASNSLRAWSWSTTSRLSLPRRINHRISQIEASAAAASPSDPTPSNRPTEKHPPTPPTASKDSSGSKSSGSQPESPASHSSSGETGFQLSLIHGQWGPCPDEWWTTLPSLAWGQPSAGMRNAFTARMGAMRFAFQCHSKPQALISALIIHLGMKL